MAYRFRVPLLAACLAVAGCFYASPFECATWNLQNYLVQNRYEDGQFRLEYPMPEARKRKIRELILQVQPELLFLQEIGSEAFLNELRLDLKAHGLDYAYGGFSGIPGASRGLAWLSQSPPASFVFHHPVLLGNDKGEMKRGIQEISFRLDNRLLTFLHVHIKSRYSDDPRDPESTHFRLAELTALERLADRIRNARGHGEVLLVGDFNTLFDSTLFDNLRISWRALPARDDEGASWTYHHQRSGDKDQIDGFWISRDSGAGRYSARLLPDPGPVPSDHRMVLLQLL